MRRPPATTRRVLAETMGLVADGCEVLTCLSGDGAPLGEDELRELLPDGLELDYHRGDQPAWWYLLAAE